MRKMTICFLVSLFALCASKAHAQKSTQTLSFGFGLEGGVVTGDFKEVYKIASGLTVRASYKVGPGFATLTTGGIALLPKSLDGEDIKAGILIPVKAGYKFIIQDRFFVMGELGYSRLKYYFDDGYGNVASSSGFTYAPTIGAQFGVFEVGLRYESTALENVHLSTGVLRLGFNF